jgi:hypothetical protein
MVNTSIKALTLSAVLILSGSKLWAQDAQPAAPQAPTEAPTADTNATRAVRMSAEIAAAITEYSRDMAALQKQIADKDISKEDAERRRKELSKRLEDRHEAIEEMAEAWADNLEESIENLELNLGDNLKLNIEPSEPKKKRLKKEHNGLVIMIGSNTLRGNNPASGLTNLELYEGAWAPGTGTSSSTFGLTFSRERRLGRSPIWARSGLGFTAYTYDFGQSELMINSPTGPSFDVLPYSLGLRRSNLTMTYFEVPMALVINPSRRGKGLNLAMGGFVGIRMGGQSQMVYRSQGMGRVTQSTTGNFYGGLFSYGLQAELGIRQFTVGIRQNFNQAFNLADLPTNLPVENQPNFYNASLFASVRLF